MASRHPARVESDHRHSTVTDVGRPGHARRGDRRPGRQPPRRLRTRSWFPSHGSARLLCARGCPPSSGVTASFARPIPARVGPQRTQLGSTSVLNNPKRSPHSQDGPSVTRPATVGDCTGIHHLHRSHHPFLRATDIRALPRRGTLTAHETIAVPPLRPPPAGHAPAHRSCGLRILPIHRHGAPGPPQRRDLHRSGRELPEFRAQPALVAADQCPEPGVHHIGIQGRTGVHRAHHLDLTTLCTSSLTSRICVNWCRFFIALGIPPGKR